MLLKNCVYADNFIIHNDGRCHYNVLVDCHKHLGKKDEVRYNQSLYMGIFDVTCCWSLRLNQ